MGYKSGADANMGVATESKVMADLEMDTAVGMETGVNTDVGADSKLVVDTSGNVGAVVGVVVGAVADVGVGTGLMMVGTETGDVVVGQAGMIAEMVPYACAAVSKILALVKVQHITVEVVEAEEYMGTGMVPSVCGGQSTAQNCRGRNRYGSGIRDRCGGSRCACGHKSRNSDSGRGCKCKNGNIGSFGSGVDRRENWTVCNFDVNVAEQDENTIQGVLSNLRVGTGVCLTFGAGMGTDMELTVSAGVGMGTKVLWVAGGMMAACSQG